MIDPFKILKYPHLSEKSISLIEKENKIVFIVDRRANKKQIKNAFEKIFGVEVEKVNTSIGFKGEKKAYIKLAPKYKASDVATKLGIL